MRPQSLALSLFLVLPTATFAQDIRFDPTPLSRCYAAGGGFACHGTAADACMRATEIGGTTIGQQFCLEEERLWWDARLNESYQSLRAAATEEDRSIDPASGQPRAVDTLRDMQRAWISFRDATCNHEIQPWFGGTGASGAWLSCQSRMTAQQTVYLDALRAGGVR